MAKRKARKTKKAKKEPRLREKAVCFPGQRTVITTVHDIHAGTLDPKELNTDARRECVALLYGEGMPIVHMAALLGAHRNTIRNDLGVLREEWAKELRGIEPAEFAGRLVHRAELLAHKAGKQDAKKAWDILSDCAHRLQTLGLLPHVTRMEHSGAGGSPLTVTAFIEGALNGRGAKRGAEEKDGDGA